MIIYGHISLRERDLGTNICIIDRTFSPLIVASVCKQRVSTNWPVVISTESTIEYSYIHIIYGSPFVSPLVHSIIHCLSTNFRKMEELNRLSAKQITLYIYITH